ncbi:MAG TPA: DUF6544 family protein [Puia sp.]|nr:DUF6544 family protein [Puia sp.]
MSSLRMRYLDEIRSERARLRIRENAIFTERDIAALPRPVQRYFRSCGYLGARKQLYARIQWAEVRMRFSDKGRWQRMVCSEFLAVPEPVRIAHLRTHAASLIPIDAIDKYQGGHGNMLIRLANAITLQDVRGTEMDQSALVTFLSECLLLPAIALQPYLRWSDVSEDCALATISYMGTTASGWFHFNERGECVLFETDHRWKTLKGGKLKRVPWRVQLSEYEVDGYVLHPGKASAYWVQNGASQEYFTGKIRNIV